MATNQPSSAAASANLSDALGSIGQSTATSDSNSPSNTASSASGGSSGSSAPTGSSGSGSVSPTSLSAAPTLGASSVSSLSNAPSLTSGLNIPSLTGLPTLSGYYSIVPPTVPPMANAPYLAKNNLPENFVFIIVGAVIAFVALVIVAWRIMTSWSINRRFRRHEAGKASYTPLADFKQKPAAASTHDLKELGKLPRNFSQPPSLFFSPTAEVARHSMRPQTAGSNHMPAGHYRDASRG